MQYDAWDALAAHTVPNITPSPSSLESLPGAIPLRSVASHLALFPEQPLSGAPVSMRCRPHVSRGTLNPLCPRQLHNTCFKHGIVTFRVARHDLALDGHHFIVVVVRQPLARKIQASLAWTPGTRILD